MTSENYRLPENAEASIIGCMLLCPDTKQKVANLINEGDFASEAYAAMFAAAMEMEEPDSAVFHELVRKRGFALPDGFFLALTDIAVNRYNVELYAKLLREDSQRRKLRATFKDIHERMELDEGTHTENPVDLISEAMDKLKEIERGTITANIADAKAQRDAFWEHRKMVDSGKGSVKTGFGPLDKVMRGGMVRSGFYILAARPGMGKTTVAIQFADYIAENYGPVLFVSLEMSLAQLQSKRISRVSGIPSDQVLLGELNEKELAQVNEAERKLSKIPMLISAVPKATIGSIRRMAKQVENLQCVFVDYLGKVSPDNMKASRYEQTSQISNDLKVLAVELDVPVLALAQLNRENTKKADRRPQLSDLRDSGSIEQDADGAIMLHWEDYYSADEKEMKPWEKVDMEFIIRKNRHGRSFATCKAGFFPATGRILEVMER